MIEQSEVPVQMKLEFHAAFIRLDVVKDPQGNLVPSVAGGSDGSVLVEMGKAELESFIKAFAEAAVAEQGVKIEFAELTATPAGDRSVQASVRVRARKSFIPATVNIALRMDVDDRLNATLSNPNCTGEGMIGSVLSKIINSKLQPLNGKLLPLAGQFLQNIRLQSLHVETGDALRIRAAFGEPSETTASSRTVSPA